MKIRTSLFLGIIIIFLFACGIGREDDKQAEPSITIKFTLASLPPTLPINQATTGYGEDEYAWTVLFSLGNSKFVEAGLVYHTGRSPSYDVEQLALDKFTVRIQEGNGMFFNFASYIYAPNSRLSISGNTITLSLPRNEVYGTAEINQSTPIIFKTSGYDDEGNIYSDSYPVGKFTSIPADGNFTDDTGETETGGQMHLDMILMQVLII